MPYRTVCGTYLGVRYDYGGQMVALSRFGGSVVWFARTAERRLCGDLLGFVVQPSWVAAGRLHARLVPVGALALGAVLWLRRIWLFGCPTMPAAFTQKAVDFDVSHIASLVVRLGGNYAITRYSLLNIAMDGI